MSSASDPRPGARNSPNPQLLACATLLPGDLLARAKPSHARPHHRLALARPGRAQAKLERAPSAHQARPRCCTGTSTTTTSRPAPISWARPPTSLGPPQTSLNRSQTISYVSGQISPKPPLFVTSTFGQQLFWFKLPPHRR